VGHPYFEDQAPVLNYHLAQKNCAELCDVAASNVSTSGDKMQAVLSELSVMERMSKVLLLLKTEVQICKLYIERMNFTPPMS
jgi:ATP-dependent Lon protease